MYIYIYVYAVRIRQIPAMAAGSTVSFHNFKSQKFKLSVSNPKNKYVAYVSVLSQISNCQGLGRKNKHEILKTDRTPNSPRTRPPVNSHTPSTTTNKTMLRPMSLRNITSLHMFRSLVSK